jgi:hypothetical protein
MTQDKGFWDAVRAPGVQPVDFLAFADHLEEQGREWDALWARGQAWLVARKARGATPVYVIERQWDEWEIGGRTHLIWSASGRLSFQWSSEYNQYHEHLEYMPPESGLMRPRGEWYLRTRKPGRQKNKYGPSPDPGPLWDGYARDFYRRLLAWRRKAKPDLWPRPRPRR